jgi:hypothetical protein
VDSSTDGTDGIVEREFPEVRLLHFRERCKVGEARNLGVQAARGDIVLFTDTDTIPGAKSSGSSRCARRRPAPTPDFRDDDGAAQAQALSIRKIFFRTALPRATLSALP